MLHTSTAAWSTIANNRKVTAQRRRAGHTAEPDRRRRTWVDVWTSRQPESPPTELETQPEFGLLSSSVILRIGLRDSWLVTSATVAPSNHQVYAARSA